MLIVCSVQVKCVNCVQCAGEVVLIVCSVQVKCVNCVQCAGEVC